MNRFEPIAGELACEGVPLREIARSVGTPVYVYSSATLERHYGVLRDALAAEGLKGENGGEALIAFAVKANSNLAVLKTLARQRRRRYGFRGRDPPGPGSGNTGPKDRVFRRWQDRGGAGLCSQGRGFGDQCRVRA